MASCWKAFSRQKFLLNVVANVQKRSNGTAAGQEEGILVPISEVRSYIERCMKAVGARESHGAALADNLLTADYRGHFSHGLNRIEIYTEDMKNGLCISNKEPEIIRETVATALVNGNNLLGPVVGNFAMKTAIKKAKETGVGWVVANASNHYGIAGYYSKQALDAGLVGMSFTNTSPLVMPTRSRKKVLGTNPISLFAPGTNGDSFELDMATSAVALGKIELAAVKDVDIPHGWGADESGMATTDPKAVTSTGAQLPLGGVENTSGYKGSGLGMLVEILCGVMGDANFGSDIRRWKDSTRVANLGQCFIVIDPEIIAPGFPERMQRLIGMCRDSEPAKGETEILVAGDPEKRHMAKCDREGGIRYHANQLRNADLLAQNLGIETMKPAI